MQDSVNPKPQTTSAEASQWFLQATQASLKAKPSLATLMLRLGAAVNAIRAAQGWYLACEDTPGTGGERNRVLAGLVLAAYLKEAIDNLLVPHCGRICILARQAGTSDDAINKLDELKSKEPDSLYNSLLKIVRDKLMFHWDEDVFRKWVRNCKDDPVEWARSSSGKEGDVVHWAAATAVLASTLPDEKDRVKRIQQVADASGLLAEVFQRAIQGYLTPYVVNGVDVPQSPSVNT